MPVQGGKQLVRVSQIIKTAVVGDTRTKKKRNEYSLLKFEITGALLNEFVLTREFSSTRRLFKKKSKDCRYQRSREKGPKERSDAKKEKTNGG